jgi:hypothetical protein
MTPMIAKQSRNPCHASVGSTGVLAGIVGGGAEVVWIALYARLSGDPAVAVARGITETFFPNLAATPLSVPLGVAIHMGLAILLGVAVAIVLRALWPRGRATAGEAAAVIGILIAVWAINFFVVLPAINPAFVGVVPYWASLASKVFFGIAAALTLQFQSRPRPAAT